MARKTISDLLKQEVNSSPAPVPESPEVNAPEAKITEPAQSPDLGQLQAQLDMLKAALEQEKSQGEKLKQQLTDRQLQEKKAEEKIKKLEQSLKQEKTQLKRLQDEVQLVEKLQTELTEEKNLVGKLYGKIQHLEEEIIPPASTAITPLLPKAMFVRYVAPGQPSTDLSDEDIGWFD
jgi:predicted RNase H-like nuclease (RuvC/YqgF family)